MLATSVNEWVNEWLWCTEAQKGKTAWLGGKIRLAIRDQQECPNTGEGSRAPGSAIKDCVCCVVLSSLDFICCEFGREWSNFLSTVTSIWVFFQMFYRVGFRPHIRVERIALMDHHAPITQLQQLATFSPSYFIYQFTFSLILVEAFWGET